MNWKLGIVVGNFLPPHRGHHQLIDAAWAQSDRLVIIVYERADDPIPGGLRAAWLKERHPEVDVRLIERPSQPQAAEAWAARLRDLIGQSPAVLFTSNNDDAVLARCLGAQPVFLERSAETASCSSAAIRLDPYLHWDFLEGGACGWYARRVVVVGAESTGTTTLARSLAAALNTSWIVEYGRDYTQARDRTRAWAAEEFARIAIEQNRRENAAARTANRILICDTDAFATGIWNRRYLGSGNPVVDRIAAERSAALYLLTGDEIRFVPDDIRDGEHIRHAMHGWFEQALAAQTVPWHLVRGSPRDRIDAALQAIGTLFTSSRWKPRGPSSGPP